MTGRGLPLPYPKPLGWIPPPPSPRLEETAGRRDPLPPSCEAVPRVPAAAAGAVPQVGAGACRERGGKRSWRLPQGSRSAEKPGLRTRSVAGRAGSGRETRPPLGLGLERFAPLRQVRPLTGALQGPLALRGPAASSPLSKARDPGFGTLSSKGRAPGGHPAQAARRGREKSLGIAFVGFPAPAPARAHRDPRLRGALTDPDDVGHPARVRDPEGAHEEPGPVFPNQTPEAPPGSGHRWAPPSVPGARPWRAPWGGSSRRGRAAAPEAPPGPAARLPSAAASGGRPAAPRTSYWGAAPPAPAPPGCRPRAARERGSWAPPGLRSGSARTPLRLASARLPRGLPPAPAAGRWRAGCTRLRPLLLQPPPMLSPGLAQSPGVELHARTHSLPAPSPRPASRLPRRPPPALPPRTPPRAHTSHSRPPRRTLARSHLRRGRGRGPWTRFGGDSRRTRILLASQMSPSALPPPVPSTARARSLGAGRGAGELAPRAGRRRQPSGPTSWRRRARRSRGTRSPPSAEARLPAPTQRAQARRRRRETDPGTGFPP